MKLLKNISRKNILINKLRDTLKSKDDYINLLESSNKTLEWRATCAEVNREIYDKLEKRNNKLSKEYNELKDKYINLLASFEILENKMNE